jgi:hypothetical protein
MCKNSLFVGRYDQLGNFIVKTILIINSINAAYMIFAVRFDMTKPSLPILIGKLGLKTTRDVAVARRLVGRHSRGDGVVLPTKDGETLVVVVTKPVYNNSA